MEKKTKKIIVSIVGIGIAIFGIMFAYSSIKAMQEAEEALDGTGSTGNEKSATELSAMKQAASQCGYALVSGGAKPGTPNESICGDMCSEYKGKNFQITDEAANEGIENAYQACIAGKPDWIG